MYRVILDPQKGLSTVKVAISMQSLSQPLREGELSIIEFLRYASRLYVDGVEFADMFFQDRQLDYAAIQTKLDDTGLKVACYDIHHSGASLQGQAGVEALDHFRRAMDRARRVGAKSVKILGESLDASLAANEALSFVADLLRLYLPELEDSALNLYLENSANPGFGSQQLASVLEQINHRQVQASFNMSNCILAREHPRQALERLQPWLAHVRAVDVRVPEEDENQNEKLVGAILGLGLVPLASLLEELGRQEYQGWISMEFTGEENPLFGIEASLKNLRQSLYELEKKGITASGEVWPEY